MEARERRRLGEGNEGRAGQLVSSSAMDRCEESRQRAFTDLGVPCISLRVSRLSSGARLEGGRWEGSSFSRPAGQSCSEREEGSISVRPLLPVAFSSAQVTLLTFGTLLQMEDGCQRALEASPPPHVLVPFPPSRFNVDLLLGYGRISIRIWRRGRGEVVDWLGEKVEDLRTMWISGGWSVVRKSKAGCEARVPFLSLPLTSNLLLLLPPPHSPPISPSFESALSPLLSSPSPSPLLHPRWPFLPPTRRLSFSSSLPLLPPPPSDNRLFSPPPSSIFLLLTRISSEERPTLFLLKLRASSLQG